MDFRKIPYLCIVLFSLCFATSLETFATEPPIRVAFIEGDGFHTMEVNGGYSGYNHDYLMKVAQYTGWEYEFVVISDSETATGQEIAQEMLQNGEIDLLGPMYKTNQNEQLFQFGEKNYGIARHVLSTLGNNNKITENSYFLQDSFSVALVRDDIPSVNAFYRIINGIEAEGEVVYVDTHQEAYDLIITGQVDTMMSLDVSLNSTQLTALTSLSPMPLYFVSTLGNTQLLDELDQAIFQIELGEYSIQNQLVDEYFGLLHTGEIILTEEEQFALAEYPVLTVGLLRGRQPYQFYNGKEEVPQGISVEILEEISQIIGVEFEYLWLDSREEMRDKIASQEIDLCATVPFDSDYDLTYFFDVVVTQPYLTNAVAWLHKTGENKEGTPHYYYLADNIPLFPDEELVEVFDFESTLWELSEQGEISLFADPYMAQYQLQKQGINNVELQSVSSIQSKICLGVGKHLDATVVGLLNHAILHLDPFVVDEIIYKNVTVENSITVEAFVREHSADILFFSTCFLLFVVLGLIYNSQKFKTLSRQDSLTKLFNAGYFHRYCESTTKKMDHGCLLLIDIDFFKQVNDSHGHHAGDKVIQEVANTLKKQFRERDIVARLGGDEFVVLIDGTCSVDNLQKRCRSILQELSTAQDFVPVTLSMGGYIFNQPTPYEELYRLADEVLYGVKEKGRNGYSFSQM